MTQENASAGAEGLLVRAESLEWAEEISQRIVHEERTMDGGLLLDVAPSSIKNKKAFVREVRAERRVDQKRFFQPPKDKAYHIEIPQPR